VFGRRSRQEQRSLGAQNVPGVMLGTLPDGGRSVTPETAMRIADVFACVRVLADSAASVPLHLYRRTDVGRERVTSGRAAQLLDRPAPATSQANLVGQLVAHMNVHGEAFVGKFKDGGQVAQLALLDPRRVQVELAAGEPVYTVTGPKGEQSRHGADDVLHVRAMGTDGLRGLSPIRQCAVAMRVAQGGGDFMDSYIAHGARPSGVLKVGAGGREGANELREGFSAQHAGAKNMHRVAVMAGDVEWVPISPTLEDLEWVEQRKLSTAEVARIFRVPPRMIGAATADPQTYANVESAMVEFVTYSLRPQLVLVEQAISNDRDLCRSGQYVEFLIDALLRADSATRAQVYTAALDPETGWMSRDEVRQLENLPAERREAAA